MRDGEFPPFWLVWREGGGEPTVKHATQMIAEGEAKRLASQNPGEQFFVLPALAVFETQKVGVTRFDLDCVPF